jgi:hypothetical protein
VTGDRRLDLYFDRPRLERIARIRHGLNPRPVRRSSISAGNSEFALREFTVVPIAIVAAIVLFLVLWASRQGVLGNEG